MPKPAVRDAVRILALHLSEKIVRAGDTVRGTVETTPNVEIVEARIATFAVHVPRTGRGRFAIDCVVPNVPFFLRRSYPITIIARDRHGASAQRTTTITVR